MLIKKCYMIKYVIISLLTVSFCTSRAQSKETYQKYISDNLSYKHLKYNIGENKCQISIYKIDFKDCTMSYPVFIKKENKTERYTIRIFLPGINEITVTKSQNGHHVINFTTERKSIIREYPDGTLLHETKQSIPLTRYDAKALEYLKNLKIVCTRKSK